MISAIVPGDLLTVTRPTYAWNERGTLLSDTMITPGTVLLCIEIVNKSIYSLDPNCIVVAFRGGIGKVLIVATQRCE